MALTRVTATTIWLKSGVRIPPGTPMTLTFNGTMIVRAQGSGADFRFHASRIPKVFSGFRPPSISTMERWVDEGRARTVTGYEVEIDGFGPDGSPNWLMVMGVI